MPHIIRYLVPFVGSEAPDRLAEVLAQPDRMPEARLREPPPVHAPRTLSWTVRSLVEDSGYFLEIEEDGFERWDLELARALSAAVDGFVSVLDKYSSPGRYGEALFFAGRTLEARSWNAPEGDLDLGPPLTDAERLGIHVGDVYDRRFRLLCNTNGWELCHGPIVAVNSWTAPLPPRDFDVATEVGFSVILLGKLDAEQWEALDRAGAAPGWRRRMRRTHGLGMPYVELRREGPLDEALLAELSGRLGCGAAGVEVPGGGRAHRWAEAYEGIVEHRGESRSGDNVVRTLNSVGALLGEGAGQLFGRGNDGWR